MRLLALLVALLAAGPALAEVRLDDRRGEQVFETAPERAVVLTWALAEQLIDLDIDPVGAPETELYRDWVSEPPLPEGVTDVGLRSEPNLERIVDLDPDVILTADVAAADVARLEEIAPVLVFDNFSQDHDNVAAAKETYLALGALFDRSGLAEERLAAQEAELDAMAAELSEALEELDHATAIRLNDAASAWVYGENSFPEYALDRLGFSSELPMPPSTWGTATRTLEDLARIETGAVLAIRPHMSGAEAFETPVWQFLPFVRAGRFAEVGPVWSYGGALSVLRHARAFRDGLLTLQ